MEFDGCNKSQDSDDVIWLDEEYAPPGPEYHDFSDYMSNPRPHSFWGRGYGPEGPPNQQNFPRKNATESFLLRCGVQKSTLKGLPKVLLRLMEPEYCGVCAYGFDNFDGARLHYISKNHTRNLKKWLAQQAKVGSKRPSEIPLRARELYCELCDIHITSKSHAESHYAGKPHRAIVEGRKIPKNPFLLQKNMRDRVEQLIRREKRSLKSTEKPATSKIAKTDKPIPPELFCDICQAPVTCTEQMTMHLNGKKHLLKEKQHILNMMTGKTAIPKPAEPIATAKDADAQSEDEVDRQNDDLDDDPQSEDGWEKWEKKYGGDEFDWGIGSGTWDDDPQ